MSNNKQIEISADIKVATTQAEASLKKLSKSFKDAFSETNANKMFGEMKKINPLINQIDTSLSKMMKSMIKDDARKQLKLMNDALKDQSKQIDQNIKKYQDLTKEIENASDAQKKGLEHERQLAIKSVREGMGKVQQFGQRRDEAKQTLGALTGADLLKIAAVAATAGRVGGSVANFVGGFDSRKMGYEAQRDSVTNSYLSGITSGGLDMGVLAASGKLGRGMHAADDSVRGKYAQRGLEAGGDIVAGGVVGGILGAGGAALSHAGKNADLMLMPQARQALLAGEQQQNIDSAMQSTAYVRELIADRMAKSRGRMGAMEAVGGGLGKNLGLGAGMGFSQDETLSAIATMGQSGLLGKERTDAGAAMRFQRQGLATIGETGGLVGGAMTGLSKQTNVLEQLKKAMQEGTKKGVETSLVKDLVGATIQIANQGSARAQDLDTFRGMMESALSGKKGSEIGRGDILAAAGGVNKLLNLQGGGGNPVLEAMQTIGVKNLMGKTGIDINKLNESSVYGLGITESSSQITKEQDALLLDAAGGDQKKVDAFKAQFDAQKKLGVLKALQPGSQMFGQLSSEGGLEEYQGAQKAGGKNASLQRARLIDEIKVALGGTRDEASAMADIFGGGSLENTRNGIKDPTAKSTERMLATVNAVADLAKDSLMAQDATAKLVKSSVAETYASVKLLTDKNAEGFKPLLKMADGQYDLNVSMQGLTMAVIANTEALLGKSAAGGTMMDEIKKKTTTSLGEVYNHATGKSSATIKKIAELGPTQTRGGAANKAASKAKTVLEKNDSGDFQISSGNLKKMLQ